MKELTEAVKRILEKIEKTGPADEGFAKLSQELISKMEQHDRIKEQLDKIADPSDAILVFKDGIATITPELAGVRIGVLKGTIVQFDMSVDDLPGNSKECDCPNCLARKNRPDLTEVMKNIRKERH